MKILDRALRWCNEKLPRQSQDKVIAYVGRALSLDLPQICRNIRYGMRADPIVRMIDRDHIDWNEVQKDYEADNLERKAKRPISEIDNEASMDAIMLTPSIGFEAARNAHLKQILGEDGPRYVEALKAMAKPEELYPLPDFKLDELFFKSLRDEPLLNYINIGSGECGPGKLFGYSAFPA